VSEKCRYCNRRLDAADPEHKRCWPFCSDRCKTAELGLWFEGRYAFSRPVDEVADDAATVREAQRRGKGPRDNP